MSPQKKFDLFLIVMYFPLCGLLILFTKINFFFTAILYIGIPALYLSIKLKHYYKKILIQTLIFSLVIVAVVDYIAVNSLSWIESSVFSYRYLGIVALEEFAWGFLYVYFIILFYTYFFDRYKTQHLPKHTLIGLKVLFGIILTFFALYIFLPNSLSVKYFYLLLSSVFLFVSIVGFIKYPKLFKKFIYVMIISIIPAFIHEFISLSLQHWIFIKDAQNYIGYLDFGSFILPYEEIFWHIIVIPVLLLLYEYFGDNLRNG